MTVPLLDVMALPIRGTQFIEAGAGTGKTHTICNLFVRLIVEAGRPVDGILVLTFTRAATAELRERIASRLRQLAHALRGGQVPADDRFAVDLLQRIDDVALVQRRLDLALAGFDAAPIHTIHGFCQRVLAEHALLSRSVFSAELLEDEQALRMQIARDFWRREVQGAGRLFVEYLLSHVAADPGTLLDRLERALARPYVIVRGGEGAAGCAAIEQAYETAFAAAAQAWQSGHEEVSALLLESPALNRNLYRVATLSKLLAALARILGDGDAPTLALPKELVRLTPKALGEGVKKGAAPPSHRFFRCCETLLRRAEELQGCLHRQALSLQRRFIDYASAELLARKRATGVQSFDDLLGSLREALHGDNAAAMRASLRRQYGAALIDEFQDTDPLQYEIFRAIYAGTDLPLYLVGDPKQAIYAFRGADVYAYLRARREIGESTHALTVNWRSDPPLIEVVNALFGSVPMPFRDAGIAFQPASPAARVRSQLLIDGEVPPPMVFWLLERADQTKPINKGDAAIRASEATAAEIARLLDGGGRQALRPVDGPDAPLTGRDIAVLVRTNAQGAQMRRALAAVGIDSVELSESSVFASDEAVALTHVLRAVATPGDDRLVRTALATDLLRDAEPGLFVLMQDERAWERIVLRFDGYHRLWREQGFFAMWQRLIESERVLERLLGRAGGARRVTNLSHLVELLQAASAAGHGGVTALIDWLVDRRIDPATRDEQSLLRLESDAELVRIVTVHRSKGLEYPIVFCPYLWDEAVREPDGGWPILYHDPDNDHVPTLSIDGLDAAAIRQLAAESRAEAMRLLYVALTRARHRCYVLWGAVNSAAFAGLSWLLHRQRRPHADDDAIANWFEGASDEDLRQDLLAVAARVPGAIELAPAPAAADVAVRAVVAPAAIAARAFTGRIAAPWRLTSYSTLIRHAVEATPDHDAGAQATVVVTDPESPAGGMFAFPRGAQAGSCLHAIFENIDFTDRLGWRAVAETQLRRHGFATDWVETVVAMLGDATRARLAPDGPRLAAVPVRQRINELEFHYPFRQIDPRRIAARVAAFDGDGRLRRQLQQLAPERNGGYLKGFIDMVFEADGRWYVVDYKSNWLGSQREDYAPSRLAAVMTEECYGLQYLIYVVALHRWLRQRLRHYDYATHFGGVFYLFVRAVGPDDDNGIFADRPEVGLVQALDACLRDGDAA